MTRGLRRIAFVGDTGVGKSALSCATLGYDPLDHGRVPFKVADLCTSVTLRVTGARGRFMGNPGFEEVEVTDCPGFGDTRGPEQDEENLDMIRRDLMDRSIHAIVIVFDDNRRINPNTQRIIRIALEALAGNGSSGFKHLAIAMRWPHDDDNKQIRGGDDAAKLKFIKDSMAKLFKEKLLGDGLAVTAEDIDQLILHRVFLLDSFYGRRRTGQEAAQLHFKYFYDWLQGLSDPALINQSMPTRFRENPLSPCDQGDHKFGPVYHGCFVPFQRRESCTKHHGGWGGFLYGYKCCGRGAGNFRWDHDDCTPHIHETTERQCTVCGGLNPNAGHCQHQCTVCGKVFRVL